MDDLLKEIRQCRICAHHLPNEPKPILSASPQSKIAIIGHAPGRVVHESGVPWEDASGDRLRSWMGVTKEQFYQADNFAIVPMGFCYPGTSKSGDLPPRKECAPQWHEQIFSRCPELRLVILIGAHAQKYYLKNRRGKNLTETVRNFNDYLPRQLPLPHPSPRNNIWLKKNPWFEMHVEPALKEAVAWALA